MSDRDLKKYLKPKLAAKYREAIESTSLFEKTGSTDLPGVIRVKSWNQALERIKTRDFEFALNTCGNEMSRHVSEVICDGSIDKWNAVPWNEIADELSEHFDDLLEKKCQESIAPKHATKSVYDCLDSYLSHTIMAKQLIGPEYEDLITMCFDLCVEGYFLCGYEGQYPDGTLVVY